MVRTAVSYGRVVDIVQQQRRRMLERYNRGDSIDDIQITYGLAKNEIVSIIEGEKRKIDARSARWAEEDKIRFDAYDAHIAEERAYIYLSFRNGKTAEELKNEFGYDSEYILGVIVDEQALNSK